MTPEQLKESILQMAIQGKLVSQIPEEGTALELLEDIKLEKEQLIKDGKIPKEKKLPDISEEEKEYDIPDNWRYVRVQDIASYITDYVANGSFATLKKNTTTYKTPNYAIFVRTMDLTANFVGECSYIDQKSYEFLEKSKLYGGELILPNIGGSIGKAFLMPDLGMPMSLAPNSIMLKFKHTIMNKYFSYIIQAPYGKKFLIDTKGGTATPKFSKTELRNMVVMLPPLKEIERIVAKIEEMLPFVDRYAASYEKLEQFTAKFPEDMKKSILQYAFEGKLVEQIPSETPSISIVNDIRAEQERLIKTKEIKREKIDTSIQYEEELPDGWCVAKLGELTRVVTKQTGFDYSKTIKPNLIEYKAENTIPLVQTKNFKGKTFNLDTDYYIPIDIAKKFPKILLDGKCLLLSIVGASIGNVGLYELEELGMIGGAICKVQLINDLFYDYLFYYLQSPLGQNEIRKNFKATAQGTITVQDVREIIVKIPPLEEQHRIVSKIEELLPFCDQLIK